jgi:hypothetical protein
VKIFPESLRESNDNGLDEAVATLENIIDKLSNIEIYPESHVRSKSTAHS